MGLMPESNSTVSSCYDLRDVGLKQLKLNSGFVLIYEITHSVAKDYLLHDSFVFATRLINMREMTHLHVCMRKSNVIDFQNKLHWKTTHHMTLAM